MGLAGCGRSSITITSPMEVAACTSYTAKTPRTKSHRLAPPFSSKPWLKNQLFSVKLGKRGPVEDHCPSSDV